MTTLAIEPLDAPLGARVVGYDPAGAVDESLVDTLAHALLQHSVLVFRDLQIEAGQLVALGRAFGDLEILPEPDKRHPVHPEIFNLSNVRPDGEIVTFDEPQSVFLRGTQRWHTDSSFRPVPCLCTLLYAHEVPPTGGETEFADMYAAWAALESAEQMELSRLHLVHDYSYSRAHNPGRMDPMTTEELDRYPPVSHPLVRTHADGRKSLYMGGHVSHIAETEPAGEAAIATGRAQIARLTERATAAAFVYRHHWRAGDLVVWDNRSTLHRLRPYDIAKHRRVMQRVTVAGTDTVS